MVGVAQARRQATFGDMVRTAVIFGILIVAVVAILPKGHHSRTPPRVDYSAELQVVSHRAPFHVLAPQGLSNDWTPTHITIAVPQNGSTVTTFDLGLYVQGADAYVQLEQSDAPGWVMTQLGTTARRTGSVTIGADAAAVSYETWVDSKGNPAFVRTSADGSTVVLDGKAPTAVLRTLAASLR